MRPEFETGDVLEPLEKVTDWRPVLAAIPNIGPAKATKLRDTMLAAGASDTFGQALTWACADKHERKEMGVKVPLWGDKTHQSVREFVLGDLDFGEGYSMRMKWEVEKVDKA